MASCLVSFHSSFSIGIKTFLMWSTFAMFLCYTSSMSKSRASDPDRVDRLNNLHDHLVDEIIAMTEAEIKEECLADGDDPEQIAQYYRAVCLNAIALWEESQKEKP